MAYPDPKTLPSVCTLNYVLRPGQGLRTSSGPAGTYWCCDQSMSCLVNFRTAPTVQGNMAAVTKAKKVVEETIVRGWEVCWEEGVWVSLPLPFQGLFILEWHTVGIAFETGNWSVSSSCLREVKYHHSIAVRELHQIAINNQSVYTVKYSQRVFDRKADWNVDYGQDARIRQNSVINVEQVLVVEYPSELECEGVSVKYVLASSLPLRSNTNTWHRGGYRSKASTDSYWLCFPHITLSIYLSLCLQRSQWLPQRRSMS